MKADIIYDLAGYYGIQETLHSLLEGAPGRSVDASAPQAASGYCSYPAEMGNSSNLETLSLSSFFSLAHNNPSHHVMADGRRQQLEGEATPDSSVYYYHHHHHGSQHYCLEPSALPMLLTPNPQEAPPPAGDGTPSPASTVLYDAPWSSQMDLCNLQSPLVGNVLQWLPNDYGSLHLAAGVAASACDGGDVGGYMGHSASGLLGLGGDVAGLRGREVRGSNNTERQRRGKMSEKFFVLRSLIPNPRKHDKASIIAEATAHIKELLRTIDELRALVEAQHQRKQNSRKISTSTEAGVGKESSSAQHSTGDPAGRPSNELLRSSWLQRKYKDTYVDVRIVEDEVNIKLVRRRKVNCLMLAAGALHELQLELLHLSAGNIGDSLVCMINSKIGGDSSVYASAIAKKLVEALEGTAPGMSSFRVSEMTWVF